MKGAIFNVGPLDNKYSGPHTYADVLFPFVNELHKHMQLDWVGIDLDTSTDNPELRKIGVEWQASYHLSMRESINTKLKRSWDFFDASEYDFLLCQPRPLTNKIENEILYKLINTFLDAGKRVFVWEQDMFTDEFTDRMREEVIFLHPAVVPTGRFKKEVYFPFFTYTRHDSESPERKLDFVFLGNIYFRQPQALQFFAPLNEAPFDKLVFGSWIANEERKKFSSQFTNFRFAGSTDHWAAIPVMRRAKATLHIVPDFARDRGLMTARVFTSQMARCLCFCDAGVVGAEKFFPKELIVQSGDDIIARWDAVQADRIRLLGERDELMKEHTVEKRVEQFLALVNG